MIMQIDNTDGKLNASGIDVNTNPKVRTNAIDYIIEQLRYDLDNGVVDLRDLVRLFPVRHTGDISKTTYLI